MDWIRTCFPDALTTFPEEAYARILHPLGPGAARDPYLSRLSGTCLLFDLETLGFLGHPLFLIGVMRPERDEADRAPEARAAWEVVQYLARDYTEEEAVVRAFAEEAARAPRWVSFNGKSFDLPFLRRRAAFHGIRLPEPEDHLDLLPMARKVYRKVLPDCRLQTLESRIFGRFRRRDLGGAEIPAAYHAFVRGGDPDLMGEILRHNRNDIVSLARLFVHLLEPEEPCLEPDLGLG